MDPFNNKDRKHTFFSKTKIPTSLYNSVVER